MSKITEKVVCEVGDKVLYDDIDKIIAGKSPKEMSKYSEGKWRLGVYGIFSIAMFVVLIFSRETILVPLWATVLAFLFFAFVMVDQSWIVVVLKAYLKKLSEEETKNEP